MMKLTIKPILFTFFFPYFLNAQSGLNVNHGTLAGANGYLTVGDENGRHIAHDNQTIQAKNGGSYKTLWLNLYGGNVAIGGSGIYYNNNSYATGIATTNPDSRLHVAGTTDASLTSNGLLMVGNGDHTTNIILDNNEIMARNGGSGSTLYINRNGGNVEFFGVGQGAFIVNDLPYGDRKNMQYEVSTGKFFYDNSSRRYKENITKLKDDWTKILLTHPVTYTRPGNPSYWEYGYIAEDIDSIGLTTMVGYDAEGKPDDVRYDKMIIYLVEMLKVQQKQIEELRSEMLDRKPKMKKKRGT